MKTWISNSFRAAALTTLFAWPVACESGESDDAGMSDDGAAGEDDAADDDDRGPLGKADQTGSCEGHCGGPSDEVCWCDDSCASFGDCCTDYEAVCTEPATCDEPNPAGCGSDDDCGDGETCITDTDACIPSACSCEGGAWLCTTDCNGGTCESAEEEPICEGPNPAGCGADNECGDGEVCVVDSNECISSACDCEGGAWLCTPDCNGGVCEPATTSECAGPNPADTCISESDCIPSGCDCQGGTWACTPDCSGGLDC